MKIRISKTDKLFSEYIRRRAIVRSGGCERCGTWKTDYKQLQCAHLISRWHKSIRWDEEAAIGLCGGCHLWIDHEAEEKIALCKKFIGEDGYEQLLSRSRAIGKPDEAMIQLYYTSKLNELEKL